MSKFNKFALVSAIALSGALGFASCSTTEDDENINPTYDGQKVKTQFAINIPRAAAGNNGSRATADQTQGETTSPFLGMKDMWLIPFSEDITSTTTSKEPIYLGSLATNNENGEGLDNGGKYYTDIEVPTSTRKFLFYGFSNNSNNSNLFVNGAFAENLPLANNDVQPKDINFKLKPILGSAINYNDGAPAKLTSVLNQVNQGNYSANRPVLP